jgi:hypothetical protein
MPESEIDTPEAHESKKVYRDAERTERDVKTIRLKTGSAQLVQKLGG